MERMRVAVLGTVMHTPVRGRVEIVDDALVLVGEGGAIARVVVPGDSGYDAAVAAAASTGILQRLGQTEYLLPGLVDLHNHAPQWPQMGKALHLPLEDWLLGKTFPLEARYSDVEFARTVYASLVDAMLANGTTTAMYFATVHLEATEALVDICLERGQRAAVGKVAMDDPATCPDYYRDESTRAGVEATEELIGYVRSHPANGGGLVQPVVTPRFIPSCTDEMLESLAGVAATHDCHVQTHCSESDWEHGYGLERFGRSDSQSLAALGLLTRKTVLAHSNFIDEADMETIGRFGAAVAHCPMSNFYFANAVFPAREALDRGVHLGLGSDISGGASPSMLRACVDAVDASRVREAGTDAARDPSRRGDPGTRIDVVEAFWMATAGGGIALDMPIGIIAPGYHFDAIVVDTGARESNVYIWPELDEPDDVFQKIVYNAGRANISSVWVQGRAVHPR